MVGEERTEDRRPGGWETAMTATLCTALLLAPSMLGCAFGGHHDRPAPLVACCDTCGARPAVVAGLIQQLRAHPNWKCRDDAAHALRDFDWRCHPEIVLALSEAVLRDCEEEVREEAAESLAKIGPAPCLPEVHAALARAAECDPDHATRKWTRRGLQRVAKHCRADCALCDAGPVPTGLTVAPPARPFGRFLLPPRGGFISPGSVLGVPRTSPPAVLDSAPPLDAQPRSYVIPAPSTPPPSGDPLDSLPRMDSVPEPVLPPGPSTYPEPLTPPPPPAEASPFDPDSRAMREPGRPSSASAYLAELERDLRDGRAERLAEAGRSGDEPRESSRPAPRRRLLPLGGLLRRGR
jgi:hypothetical protein